MAPALLCRLRRLGGLSWSDRWAVAWLVGWLGVVEIGLRLLSIDRLSRLLGVPLRLSGPEEGLASMAFTDTRSLDQLSVRERHLAQLLNGVARRWPWGSGPCLRQALVLGHLLRAHGPSLRLGVARDDGAVVAHAWVDVYGASLGDQSGYALLRRS